MALAWLLSSPAQASSEPVLVAPDRPDIANGTFTVPPAHVQVESGVQVWGDGERIPRLAFGLRLGLTPRIELRMLETDRVLASPSDADGGFSFSVKMRLRDSPSGTNSPSVGVQAGLIAWRPPGAVGLLLVSQPLGSRVTLDLNAGAGVRLPSPADEPLAHLLVAASCGVNLTKRWMMFGEAVLEVPAFPFTSMEIGVDGGFVAVVHDRIALDLAVSMASLQRYGAITFLHGVTFLLDVDAER